MRKVEARRYVGTPGGRTGARLALVKRPEVHERGLSASKTATRTAAGNVADASGNLAVRLSTLDDSPAQQPCAMAVAPQSCGTATQQAFWAGVMSSAARQCADSATAIAKVTVHATGRVILNRRIMT